MSKEYKKVKLKNGEVRYVFDVSLGVVNGKRKRTTVRAKTVKEGRQKVAQLQIGNHVIAANDSMKFKDAYDLYLTSVKPKLSQTTYDQKVYAIKNYQVFLERPINKVTKRDIQAWYNELDFAFGTKRHLYSMLSAFFRWTVNNNVLQINPCVGIELGRNQHKEMSYYTESEFWQLYKGIDDATFTRKAEAYRMGLLVLMYCGLRKGELCGLSAPDLVGNELHLHHTVKRTTNDGFIISTEFKNEYSRRIVPVPNWLVYDLKRFLETDSYPFKSLYKSLRLCSETVIKRDNLKHIRVHDLRHSYASMLISKGVDIFTVSRLMGHSSATITSKIYGHLYNETRQSISDLL